VEVPAALPLPVAAVAPVNPLAVRTDLPGNVLSGLKDGEVVFPIRGRDLAIRSEQGEVGAVLDEPVAAALRSSS